MKDKGTSFCELISMTSVFQNAHCDHKSLLTTLSAFELEYWNCALAFGNSVYVAAEISSSVYICVLISKM